jgi:hypothetical protein
VTCTNGREASREDIVKKDYVTITRKALVGAALVGALILTLVSGAPAQPPQAVKDVIVVNTPTQPVPVTGSVEVTGSTSVSGTVNALQTGLWTMGIDPARNRVSLADSPSFFFDTNLAVVNNGQTAEVGPFDLSSLGKVRIIGRAVNGNVTFKVIAHVTSTTPALLDQFTINGEDGNRYHTAVYDVPPPSISVLLTETGPGGSNYQVILIGR